MYDTIHVEEYNPIWKEIFESERKKIVSEIEEFILKIEHIGSTAIEGLASKPIIDIMIGVSKLSNADKCIPFLEKMNYQYIPEHEKEMPYRRFFRKPPRSSKKRDFHIHICEITHDFWKRQLLFRDYLRKNPKVRDEYGTLKIKLAEEFREDRHAYTDAKSEFILAILKKAEKEM